MARRVVNGLLIAVAVITACGAQMLAQGARGTIRATVLDPQGGTFPIAFVQAKREPSGPSIDGKGGAGGVYTIDVPAGTYEISANVPGMKSFRRGGVIVVAGQTSTSSCRSSSAPRTTRTPRI